LKIEAQKDAFGNEVKDDKTKSNDALMVSASSDSNIKIWDIRTGKKSQELLGHKSDVQVIIQISYLNETFLVSGGKDKQIKLWSIDGEEEKNMNGHEDTIICLFEAKWYKDRKLIISGSADWSIGVWDLLKGNCAKFIKEHKGNISSVFRLKNVDYSKEGNDLVSASYDNKINFWKVEFKV